MTLAWWLGYLLLVVALIFVDEMRFKVKVERRLGPLLWSIALGVAIGFGYVAGAHDAFRP